MKKIRRVTGRVKKKENRVLKAVNKSFLAQVAPEYLTTVVLAVTIIAISLYYITTISFGAASSTPTICNFNLGISCTAIVIGSNAQNTILEIAGTNIQQYPMQNLVLTVALGTTIYTAPCSPALIQPGNVFNCTVTTSKFISPGALLSGNMTAQAQYCGFNGGQCGSAQIPQSYVGIYSSRVASNATVYSASALAALFKHST